MAGPWEQYQAAQDGPWTQYADAKTKGKDSSTLGDLAAGLVRGAGSIGATILAPIDIASDLIEGRGLSLQSNRERRQKMTDALGELGADTNSFAFQAGKIGGEIAGTAGAGGVVANGLRAVAPAAANVPTVANVLRAVETGGAAGGNLLSRTAGGAVSGGISAGMVDPTDAGLGVLAGAAAPTVLKVAGAAGSKAGQVLRGTPAEPQRLAAAKAAQEAGYVIPPSDIRQQGMLTEAMGGLSGKIKTAQEASARNQSVTNDLAKKALGLPKDQPLTREALLEVRKAAKNAYEVVRGAGVVIADKEYNAAISKIAAESQGAARSFPGLKKDEISTLVESLKQPAFDSGDAIDAIHVLRDQADSFYAKGEKGAGKAYKSASKALEDALERHLTKAGDPEALNAFKEARQAIAKTYTVEKALNSQTGDVSAQVLARDLVKGKPLSGGLLTAAKTGEAFPKATQALKESPKSVSPLDWAVGAMGGTATGNPLMLATLAARPAVRAGLLSRPVQSWATRDVGPTRLNLLAADPRSQALLARSLPVLAADQ